MSAAVEVNQVSITFNMSKERVTHLKEFFINLAKRQLLYEEFIALKDVSFTIEQGDVFGIVGLNGSGKSTLLKVISGILKPAAGSVNTYGTISPLIELGAGFDMELTARENIFLNGSILGYTKKQLKENFDSIVDFAEMWEFIDTPMKNYSSGMVARVAFAIATIVKPDILIVDEILAVGDFQFQQKCEQRISQLMAGGTTVIIVSHSIEQIERLCKNCMWLKRGQIEMIGPMQAVCDAYKRS